MTPLDLTVAPPRSPKEQMLGICFLPRTIDKIRAELPGGKPGSYFVEPPYGMSAYVLHKLNVKLDDLRKVVADAADERAVEAWLAEHADLTARDRINERVETLTVGSLAPPVRTVFNSLYASAPGAPDHTTIHAILEADDATVGA